MARETFQTHKIKHMYISKYYTCKSVINIKSNIKYVMIKIDI